MSKFFRNFAENNRSFPQNWHFFGKTKKKKFVTRLLLEQTKKMANISKIKGHGITLNIFANYQFSF
jgi:hypothetical protein